MRIQTLVAPLQEPVSLGEARGFLRLGTGGDDALLATLVRAAREAVEARTGVALEPRTVRETFDPARMVRAGEEGLLPGLGPVQQVVSARAARAGGVLQALPEGSVVLAGGRFRPPAGYQQMEVDYVAGHPAGGPRPEAQKAAILETLAAAFARRDAGPAPDGPVLPWQEPRL